MEKFFYTKDHRQLKLSDMERMEITLSNGKVIKGYRCDGRVDKDYGLNGFRLYQIRHCDFEWEEPSTIENYVLVNHMCDFLTKSRISIPEDGYRDIIDWSYS